MKEQGRKKLRIQKSLGRFKMMVLGMIALKSSCFECACTSNVYSIIRRLIEHDSKVYRDWYLIKTS